MTDCSLGQVGHVYTTVPIGKPELSSIFNSSSEMLYCSPTESHVHTLGVSDEASDTHKRLRGRVKQVLAGEFLLCGGGGGWRDV